jgi:hypothetical protein
MIICSAIACTEELSKHDSVLPHQLYCPIKDDSLKRNNVVLRSTQVNFEFISCFLPCFCAIALHGASKLGLCMNRSLEVIASLSLPRSAKLVYRLASHAHWSSSQAGMARYDGHQQSCFLGQRAALRIALTPPLTKAPT